MAEENGKWLKQKWSDFEGFVEGVIYDRDLSVSARLFGLFLRPFLFYFQELFDFGYFVTLAGLFLKINRLIVL